MFFYEGQTCPVCGQYFGERDDIVTCPECGAPHHRACWQQEGHCHFEQLHGTGKSWDTAEQPEQTPPPPAAHSPQKRCLRCGYENTEYSEFCARCGLELKAEDWVSQAPPVTEQRPPVGQYTPPVGGYTPFGKPPFADPYGGVPRTATIEGVPVDTVAQIVGPNAEYYLPRFYKMANGGKKTSWNWAAFIFGYNWLLYRKTFLPGSIVCVLVTVLEFVNELLMDKAIALAGATYAEELITMMPALMGSMQGRVLWLLMGAFSLIMLAADILIGVFGNYLYMKSVLKKAKKWQQDPNAAFSQNVFRSGGVSFFTAILPDLVLSAITMIIFNIQALFF